MSFDGGETTGIYDLRFTDLRFDSHASYDLQGRRVEWRAGTGPTPTGLKKGVYVKDGRKVVIK